MTRGILDPAEYYYRRLFVDAVRAVDAARAHPAVDGDRVSVAGISQGGGLCIAVASLRDDVFAAMPEVPFLADIRRATQLIDTRPYSEIVRYLEVHRDSVDAVFRTLNLIDVALLARRARAPALFAVGLMDNIPPSTVYAAFNAYGGPKEIVEYPYNDHDGGAVSPGREGRLAAGATRAPRRRRGVPDRLTATTGRLAGRSGPSVRSAGAPQDRYACLSGRRGGVVTQRPAKPCTPVRFRSSPLRPRHDPGGPPGARSSEMDQVLSGERTAELLHASALAQPAKVNDEEPGIPNNPPTSDFAAASSPERNITR